jgi:hypothetical protein
MRDALERTLEEEGRAFAAMVQAVEELETVAGLHDPAARRRHLELAASDRDQLIGELDRLLAVALRSAAWSEERRAFLRGPCEKLAAMRAENEAFKAQIAREFGA